MRESANGLVLPNGIAPTSVPIDRYNGQQGRIYETPTNRGSGLILDILRELIGVSWGEHALGMVHSARPSILRVVQDEAVFTDAIPWRVTVIVDRQGMIVRILQESVAWMPSDTADGRQLMNLIEERRSAYVHGISAVPQIHPDDPTHAKAHSCLQALFSLFDDGVADEKTVDSIRAAAVRGFAQQLIGAPDFEEKS